MLLPFYTSKHQYNDVKKEDTTTMSLFDNVANGQIQINPDALLTESTEDSMEEYMLEAM